MFPERGKENNNTSKANCRAEEDFFSSYPLAHLHTGLRVIPLKQEKTVAYSML